MHINTYVARILTFFVVAAASAAPDALEKRTPVELSEGLTLQNGKPNHFAIVIVLTDNSAQLPARLVSRLVLSAAAQSKTAAMAPRVAIAKTVSAALVPLRLVRLAFRQAQSAAALRKTAATALLGDTVRTASVVLEP